MFANSPKSLEIHYHNQSMILHFVRNASVFPEVMEVMAPICIDEWQKL